MKKILFMLLIVLPFKVQASTIVMDTKTNRVLYDDNIYEKKLIASTSKIMTALVVINNTDLNKTITADESILKSYGSGIYIEIGEKMKVIDLLYGLMLRSGNDAAILLANYVGGSMEGFQKLMNDTAINLGLKDTYFINSTGLENEAGEGNTSTAYDMAKLMSYAIKNKTFRHIVETKRRIVRTNYKTYEWTNKNKLLFNYKYTTGGKTGYTKKAYRTLVTTASKNNKHLVIVTLDESNDFLKHEKLYEDTFNKYENVLVVDKDSLYRNKKIVIKDDVYMLLKKGENKKIKINQVKINDATNRLGYLSILLNDKEYKRVNYYDKSYKQDKFKTKIKSAFYEIFT